MRTYTDCMKSTPISVLRAISRFPLLKDKIMTDSALTVIKAEAQNNILGKDYRDWDTKGCHTGGWTPFGLVREAIENVTEKYESTIHHQAILSSDILEKLAKCKFNLSNREEAMTKHKNKTTHTRLPRYFTMDRGQSQTGGHRPRIGRHNCWSSSHTKNFGP